MLMLKHDTVSVKDRIEPFSTIILVISLSHSPPPK